MKRFFMGLLLLGACLLGGWLTTRGTFPEPATSGTVLSGRFETVKPLPRRFRVATFNIHSGVGDDGTRNLDAVGALIREYDFVGLNEVRGTSPFQPHDQAELLAKTYQGNWLFAPTEHNWWGERFGNACLARYAVRRWERIPFPRQQGNGYRNRVEYQFETEFGPLILIGTHLDRKADRETQLSEVLKRFLSLPAPVILMGDLNTKRTDPQLQSCLSKPGVVDCLGMFASGPLVKKRIDWILARGLRCKTAGLVDNTASDHPVAWAELEAIDEGRYK